MVSQYGELVYTLIGVLGGVRDNSDELDLVVQYNNPQWIEVGRLQTPISGHVTMNLDTLAIHIGGNAG